MKRTLPHKRRWNEADTTSLLEDYADLTKTVAEAVHLVVERLEEVNERLDRIEKQIDPEIEIERQTVSKRSVN